MKDIDRKDTNEVSGGVSVVDPFGCPIPQPTAQPFPDPTPYPDPDNPICPPGPIE